MTSIRFVGTFDSRQSAKFAGSEIDASGDSPDKLGLGNTQKYWRRDNLLVPVKPENEII